MQSAYNTSEQALKTTKENAKKSNENKIENKNECSGDSEPNLVISLTPEKHLVPTNKPKKRKR